MRDDVLIAVPVAKRQLPGRRVMVVAPHPDDEAIGCGGTLSLYKDLGADISVVYLTDGEHGNAFCEESLDELVARRRAETERAGARLGISSRRFLCLPDTAVRCTRQARRRLVTEILQAQPDVIFIPSQAENHRDHRAAFQICAHAISKYNRDLDVFVYEVWTPLRANCVVPIRFEDKAAVIREYQSQLDESELYLRATEGLARYRAASALLPCLHAESYWYGSRSQFLKYMRRVSDCG